MQTARRRGGQINRRQRDPWADMDRAETVAGTGSGRDLMRHDRRKEGQTRDSRKSVGLGKEPGNQPDDQAQFEPRQQDQKWTPDTHVSAGNRLCQKLVSFQSRCDEQDSSDILLDDSTNSCLSRHISPLLAVLPPGERLLSSSAAISDKNCHFAGKVLPGKPNLFISLCIHSFCT